MPRGLTTTTTYVVGISLCLLGLYAIAGPSLRALRRPGIFLLIAMPVIAFSTVLWSPDPEFTSNRSARVVLYIGFGILFAEFFEFSHLIAILTRALLLAILCSDIITVVRPDLGLSHIGANYENAWRGATTHKNMLGQVCSIGVLVSVFSIAYRRNHIVTSITTLLLSCVTLGLSQSATSVLACAASLAVAALFAAAARSSVLAKTALIVAAAGVAVVPVLAVRELTFLAEYLGRSHDLTGRTYVWEAVSNTIDRAPIWGYYYGFWNIDSRDLDFIWNSVGYKVPHSHNSWLDIWLQLGLPGLIIFISINLNIVMTGLKRYFASKRTSIAFLLALFSNLFVRSFVEVEFTDPFPSSLFWVALIFGCLGRPEVTHTLPRDRRSPTQPLVEL